MTIFLLTNFHPQILQGAFRNKHSDYTFNEVILKNYIFLDLNLFDYCQKVIFSVFQRKYLFEDGLHRDPIVIAEIGKECLD